MLKSLFIQNYTLIDKQEISFENGFSVITGETGAGKSVMLGAINLLLGQRTDVKSIRNGAAKSVIEASFQVTSPRTLSFLKENELEDGNDCIIRREILTSGKSRAFVNDTPVQVTLLKELGEQLIDVHSQHKNLLLNNEDFQISVLDTLAANKEERNAYTNAYQQYKEAKKALEKAEQEAANSKAEEDFLSYQLEQLTEAKLQEGELEELEEEAELLNHAEEIKQNLYESYAYLQGEEGGILSNLRSAINALNSVSHAYAKSQEWSERLNSTYIEIKDIADEVESDAESIEFNPKRLEYVNDRLDTLYSLQKKHGKDSIEELIELRDELQAKLSFIENSEEEIKQLKAKVQTAFTTLKAKAKDLTSTRTKSAKLVEKEMVKRLVPLGMPNVAFKVELTSLDNFTLNGNDSVRFLFNANKGIQLQDLSQIASGGEIARVMLSLKALMAGASELPTIIFDEIDTGISGQIAEKMAYIMKEMGENERQVISITHLPQIAAKGKAHYKVFKEDNNDLTTSHIIRLTDEERINEIANMLSGSSLTQAAISNAKELLKN